MKPITRSRLTAIVTQIEQSNIANVKKSAARLERSDLPLHVRVPARRPSISLAPELTVKPQDATPQAGELDDEEAIRREALERLRRDYMKPDQKE
ncbi:hypothetical protein [Aureimonas glaciei]|nr:hypothetical protein [Aureimonas glaciei]